MNYALLSRIMSFAAGWNFTEAYLYNDPFDLALGIASLATAVWCQSIHTRSQR